MSRGLFRGRGLQGIDAKGRVGIPASLRATIEANSADRTVVIDRHATKPCLIGYDRGWSDQLRNRIERDHERRLERGETVDRDADFRRAFATAEDLPFDASGRFVLPPFHRSKAQLGDQAVFLGLGDTFEIWDPATLVAQPDIDEGLREVIAFDLSQKGRG